MKKTKYLKEVRKEIRHIKEHATKKELSKLDFNTFDPEFPELCIYGQMTGWYSSDRAKELYSKSIDDFVNTYKDIIKGNYFTYLEHYVCFYGQNEANEKIIQYLKGEIKKIPKLDFKE